MLASEPAPRGAASDGLRLVPHAGSVAAPRGTERSKRAVGPPLRRDPP